MPDVRYTFVASGASSVVNAFKAIDAAAARSAASVQRAARAGGGGGRMGATQQLGQQVARDQKAALQRRNQFDRQMHNQVQANQRRAAVTEAQQYQRGLNQRVAADRQNAGARARLNRGLHNEIVANQRRANAAEGRLYQRGLDQRASAERRAQQRSLQTRQRSGRRLGRLASGIGEAAVLGTAALVGAGVGFVGSLGRESVQLEDRASRIAVKGRMRGTGRALRQEAEAVAAGAPGVRADDVLSGTEAFVSKAGRLDLARSFQGSIAQVSQATGTSSEDLGRVAADLFEKFDVSTVEDMNNALARLAEQGKRGAFELEDMARQFPRMAASMKRFGFGAASGKEAVGILGGLAQIARRSTGNAQQASTAVENMFRELIVKSATVKKFTGVDVFEDEGKTRARDIRSLLPEVIAGAGGNKEQLQKIFGERGIRAVSPLIEQFNALRESGKSVQEAMIAIKEKIAEAVEATGAEANIKKDAAAMQQTTSAQLTAAWEALRAVAGDELNPVIGQLAKQFLQMAQSGDIGALFHSVAEGLNVFGVALDSVVGFLIEKGVIDRDKLAATARENRASQELQLAQGGVDTLAEQLGPAGVAAVEKVKKAGGVNEIFGTLYDPKTGLVKPSVASGRQILAGAGVSQEQYEQYLKAQETLSSVKEKTRPVLFAGDISEKAINAGIEAERRASVAGLGKFVDPLLGPVLGPIAMKGLDAASAFNAPQGKGSAEPMAAAAGKQMSAADKQSVAADKLMAAATALAASGNPLSPVDWLVSKF